MSELESKLGAYTERLDLPSGQLIFPVEGRYESQTTGFEVVTLVDPHGWFKSYMTEHFGEVGRDLVYRETRTDGQARLVVKTIGRKPHGFFANTGKAGNETLIEEFLTDQRQRKAEGIEADLAIPFNTAIGYVDWRDSSDRWDLGEMVLGAEPFPGSQIGLLSPFYRMDNKIGDYWGLEAISSDPEMAAHQLVVKLLAMSEEVTPEEAMKYGSPEATLDLIVDPRMKNYEEKSCSFQATAKMVNDSFREMFRQDSLRELIEQRLKAGKVKKQHGDPRPENIFSIKLEDGRVLMMVSDPVRLRRKKRRKKTGKEVIEWVVTDDLLQIGMTAAWLYLHPRNDMPISPRDFAGQVIKAYGRLEGPAVEQALFEATEVAQLMGLAIAYGITVEAHVMKVRGSRWDGSGYSGVTDESVGQLLETVRELKESNFLGWQEWL
jgi:hypothetical protein